MRKKGSYHKNRPFRLLVAAALRFVQSYLNDIAFLGYSLVWTQCAKRCKISHFSLTKRTYLT